MFELSKVAQQVIAIVAIIAAVLVWRSADKANQQSIGASQAITKAKEANKNAINLGKRAAAKSGQPAGVGVLAPRDPSTRND